jgi:ubiquinone biosynthesis protein
LSNEGLPLSRDYAILAKALYSIEKSGKELAPTFKIDKIAVPFVKKIVLQKINPVRLTSSFINQISLLANSLKSLPLDIQRIVRKLEEEDLNINLYHKGIDDAKETLRLSADHLSLAVVCAGFLVGSSIIVTTGMKPHLFGHPALGIIGYIISGLLGLFLMIDIIWARFKSRK